MKIKKGINLGLLDLALVFACKVLKANKKVNLTTICDRKKIKKICTRIK